MGLFDSWRRKKAQQSEPKTVVRGREIMRTEAPKQAVPAARPITTAVQKPAAQSEMNSLLAEYQRLVQRREALTTERTELTTRLDRGELTAAQFHKELRARIQEAAQVSENLRATAARLSELGYTGLGR